MREGWGIALLATVVAAQPACLQDDAEGQGEPHAVITPGPFQQIGIVEGFYGTPWSHADRLDILRFMGRVGMNTYYYAPKNDPYHRQRWRDPYPADVRGRLEELVHTARAAGVTFYYSLSPGLTMVYSDSSDWEALRAKIAAIQELGVEHFALMLDDVPPTLTHPGDREAFTDLADAHANLINRTYEFLTARYARLAVTPTTYTNAWGDREYLRRLGEAVPPSIPFFWTGPDVASPVITAGHAREWANLTGRPPLIWDNYPVNDYARWRLFLGPLRGRSRDLSDEAMGIIANPMNQAHASMLPLTTVARYGRDPAGYRPEGAVRTAARTLHGAHVASKLEPFLEVYGDYGWNLNVFEPLVVPGHRVNTTAIARSIDRLEMSLQELAEVASREPSVQALTEELAPLVSTTRDRLRQLTGDSTYERHDDLLVYRTDLDHIEISRPPRTITVDGHLDEWENNGWRSLHGSGRSDSLAEISMARDDHRIMLALRVRDGDLRVEAGARIAEGDHVTVIVDWNAELGVTHIRREDPVVLLGAPSADDSAQAAVFALDFHGFMGKNIAVRRNLRFSEFFLTTLGTPLRKQLLTLRDSLRYRARRTSAGYVAELSMWVARGDELRMTVVVTDAHRDGRRYRSLPIRNFPGNPATFAEVVFQQE